MPQTRKTTQNELFQETCLSNIIKAAMNKQIDKKVAINGVQISIP